VHARPSLPALGDVVRELAAAGMRVSVDTFDPDEIRTAVAAGAELVLSVKRLEHRRRTRSCGHGRARGGSARPWQLARHAGAEPRQARRLGVPCLIDPILDAIGYGSWLLGGTPRCGVGIPEVEMLMGIGNLTELTAADSTAR